MPRQGWDEDGAWWDDNKDDCCLSCGDRHYRVSRVEGLCVECASLSSRHVLDDDHE